MYLNLAASWKDLAVEAVTDRKFTKEQIELVRLGFYGGALSTLVAQRNITAEYEGNASDTLFQALWDEARGEVLEISRTNSSPLEGAA